MLLTIILIHNDVVDDVHADVDAVDGDTAHHDDAAHVDVPSRPFRLFNYFLLYCVFCVAFCSVASSILSHPCASSSPHHPFALQFFSSYAVMISRPLGNGIRDFVLTKLKGIISQNRPQILPLPHTLALYKKHFLWGSH